MSLNADWYEYIAKKPTNLNSLLFWKKKKALPITNGDKKWTEDSLLLLADMFDPIFFKSLATITPDTFNYSFNGTEDDAEYILEKVASIMNIKLWEIQLMFYSDEPTKFSEGIVATPQEKLKGGWHSRSGKYVNNGLGNKELWIELRLLKDPVNLIAQIANELANYKLQSEYDIEEENKYLSDLTIISFGFGIFLGNSYFKFSQWSGNSHQGWEMKRSGGLPEQIIAYAMAWLAHYRNEETVWRHYLNKTMLKYFETSYTYIDENKGKMNWV